MKKLIRSTTNRKFAGVLGGLGKYLEIDATVLRVLFIILLFPTGFFPLILIYFLMMFIIPNEV